MPNRLVEATVKLPLIFAASNEIAIALPQDEEPLPRKAG
jgi:hypothetical protein